MTSTDIQTGSDHMANSMTHRLLADTATTEGQVRALRKLIEWETPMTAETRAGVVGLLKGIERDMQAPGAVVTPDGVEHVGVIPASAGDDPSAAIVSAIQAAAEHIAAAISYGEAR